MKKPIIGFDAMGGDKPLYFSVKAAFRAAQENVSVMIFGDQLQIENVLNELSDSWKGLSLSIIHCSEIIGMHEKPTRSVIMYSDSSLVRMVEYLSDGKVDAVVSAGNSGALVAAAVLKVGIIDGIRKPALASCLPTIQKERFLLLDLGGTVDCKVDHLVQFAMMGACYMRVIEGLVCPRVALLSNGHEVGKGSAVVKGAYEILSNTNGFDYQFIGNIESRDILNGHADVVVADGFVGNIMLKMAEGMIHAVNTIVKQEIKKSFITKMRLLFARPVLEKIFTQFDYRERGGALVLGINRPVFIAHGASDERALFHAIFAADRFIKGQHFEQCTELIKEHIVSMGQQQSLSVDLLQV